VREPQILVNTGLTRPARRRAAGSGPTRPGTTRSAPWSACVRR